jgi:large subunit ribosomal protein L25
MKTVSLSGSLRANVGKTDANALRAKGWVPCVIYGGKEQIHFSADERTFKNIIYTPDTNLVNITIDGNNYNAVVQEAQFHKINDKLIHVDFLQVFDGKPVTVQIPVKTLGTAEGVKEGGKLNVEMRKLKVRGLVNKLPERIELNVEKLSIGKSISVGDIKMDGLSILHPKNISVVSCQVTRAVVEEVVAPTVTTAVAATATPGTPGTTPAATATTTPPPAKK